MESASQDTARKLGRTARWQGDLQGQGLLVWEAGKLGNQRVSKPQMGISGAFTATKRLGASGDQPGGRATIQVGAAGLCLCTQTVLIRWVGGREGSGWCLASPWNVTLELSHPPAEAPCD